MLIDRAKIGNARRFDIGRRQLERADRGSGAHNKLRDSTHENLSQNPLIPNVRT
jgi:ribosomal protein L44E